MLNNHKPQENDDKPIVNDKLVTTPPPVVNAPEDKKPEITVSDVDKALLAVGFTQAQIEDITRARNGVK